MNTKHVESMQIARKSNLKKKVFDIFLKVTFCHFWYIPRISSKNYLRQSIELVAEKKKEKDLTKIFLF